MDRRVVRAVLCWIVRDGCGCDQEDRGMKEAVVYVCTCLYVFRCGVEQRLV